MNNVLTLVGRLVDNINLTQEDDSKMIVIAINRNYKSKDGIYETDFIDVELNRNLATNVGNYCFRGDIIGVRGRIETYYTINENEEKRKNYKIVADSLTFLSSGKSNINKVE